MFGTVTRNHPYPSAVQSHLSPVASKSNNQEATEGNLWLGAYTACSNAVRVTNGCVGYPEVLHSVVKCINSATMVLTPWVHLPKLAILTTEGDRLMDALRFPMVDVRRIVNFDYYYDIVAGRVLNAAANLSFLVSNFGATMHLLGFVEVLDLDKIALGISRVSIFGCRLPPIVAEMVVGTVGMEFQALAFFFLGIQTAIDIVNGHRDFFDFMKLLNCIAEVAHKTFMVVCIAAMATTSGLVTAGVLGVIANSLGIYVGYHEILDRGWKQEEFPTNAPKETAQ